MKIKAFSDALKEALDKNLLMGAFAKLDKNCHVWCNPTSAIIQDITNKMF